MKNLELKKIEPIRQEQMQGSNIWHGQTFSLPIYPPNEHAKEFKAHRRELGIFLGDAAKRLGISVGQVSDLEHGAFDVDWELAVELLEAP